MPEATAPSPPGTSRRAALLQIGVVMGLLAALLSMMSVSDAVTGGIGAKLFLLGRMALMVLICTWFLRRGGQRWSDVGLRRPPRWWPLPLLVIGGFIVVLVVSSFMMNSIFPAAGVPAPQVKSMATVRNFAEFLFFATLVAWGSAAFGEEMLMRGFVLDRIARIAGSRSRKAVVAVIVLQGALFGLLHFYQGLGGILVTGTIGVIFGFIWLLGGRNLWACIILHGLINTVSDIEAYDAPPVPVEAVQQDNRAS